MRAPCQARAETNGWTQGSRRGEGSSDAAGERTRRGSGRRRCPPRTPGPRTRGRRHLDHGRDAERATAERRRPRIRRHLLRDGRHEPIPAGGLWSLARGPAGGPAWHLRRPSGVPALPMRQWRARRVRTSPSPPSRKAAERRSEARPQSTWIDAFDEEGPGDVRSATAARAWAAFGTAAVRPPGGRSEPGSFPLGGNGWGGRRFPRRGGPRGPPFRPAGCRSRRPQHRGATRRSRRGPRRGIDQDRCAGRARSAGGRGPVARRLRCPGPLPHRHPVYAPRAPDRAAGPLGRTCDVKAKVRPPRVTRCSSRPGSRRMPTGRTPPERLPVEARQRPSTGRRAALRRRSSSRETSGPARRSSGGTSRRRRARGSACGHPHRAAAVEGLPSNARCRHVGPSGHPDARAAATILRCGATGARRRRGRGRSRPKGSSGDRGVARPGSSEPGRAARYVHASHEARSRVGRVSRCHGPARSGDFGPRQGRRRGGRRARSGAARAARLGRRRDRAVARERLAPFRALPYRSPDT